MVKILSKKPITLEEAKSLGLFFVGKRGQNFLCTNVAFGRSMVRLTNLFTTESWLIKEKELEDLDLFTGEILINIDYK